MYVCVCVWCKRVLPRYCFKGQSFKKHMMVALGEYTYLALPLVRGGRGLRSHRVVDGGWVGWFEGWGGGEVTCSSVVGV
jgi:hypothetical protein